ncbi:MAG: 1-acyl-sn-glycerol-3-phosphate acyltransferase [Christensenellales bacterium]
MAADGLGAFPTNREGNDLKAMKKSMEILKQGRVLGIFPESTRSKPASFPFMKAR